MSREWPNRTRSAQSNIDDACGLSESCSLLIFVISNDCFVI